MANYGTFDLASAYSAAENIKGARQDRELRGLQIEGAKLELDRARQPKELTRDDMVDNTELLAMGAAAVEADPGSAAYWIPVLQKRGVVRPDLQWQGVPPEQLQAAARQLGGQARASLKALDPKKYDDKEIEKRSAGMQLFIEEGGDPSDPAAFREWRKKETADKPDSETFGAPVKVVRDGMEMYVRPGNRGGERPAPRGYVPESKAESTAPESLIHRQVVNYYGGLYNPETGMISGLDKEQTRKVNQLTAKASRLYRDSNGALTTAEAIQRAAGDEPGDGKPRPRAEDDKGNAVEWDGKDWVPAK